MEYSTVMTVNKREESVQPSKTKAKRKTNLYGEGSIYQRKDGRWVTQVVIGTKDNGKADIKYYYTKSEAEAKKKLKEIRQTIALLAEKANLKNVPVDECFLTWLGFKENHLKGSSYERLVGTVKKQVLPYIGHIDNMQSLTTYDIQENVINKMRQANYSWSSIKKSYNAINGCCKYAMSCVPPIISINPCTNVMLPKKADLQYTPASWFDKEQRDKIEEISFAIYNNGKRRYSTGEIYPFMMETGLRMGEAIALTWRDIEDSDGRKVIKVNKNYIYIKDYKENKYKFVLQQSTKTQSGYRYVPLTNKAVQLLDSMKQRRYYGLDSPVFANSDGNPLRPSKVEKNFLAICKFGDIKDTDGVLSGGVHRLRHTFASRLFEKGIDIKTISTLLGHSSVQITYDIYIHLAEKQKVKAIIQLEEI